MKRKATALLLVLVGALTLGACAPRYETYSVDTCPPGYALRGLQCHPLHPGYWQGHYYPTTPMRPTRVQRTRPVTVREKTVVKQKTGGWFSGTRSKTTTYRSTTVRSGRR
jgi:hypothetical protein